MSDALEDLTEKLIEVEKERDHLREECGAHQQAYFKVAKERDEARARLVEAVKRADAFAHNVEVQRQQAERIMELEAQAAAMLVALRRAMQMIDQRSDQGIVAYQHGMTALKSDAGAAALEVVRAAAESRASWHRYRDLPTAEEHARGVGLVEQLDAALAKLHEKGWKL